MFDLPLRVQEARPLRVGRPCMPWRRRRSASRAWGSATWSAPWPSRTLELHRETSSLVEWGYVTSRANHDGTGQRGRLTAGPSAQAQTVARHALWDGGYARFGRSW